MLLFDREELNLSAPPLEARESVHLERDGSVIPRCSGAYVDPVSLGLTVRHVITASTSVISLNHF